MTDPLYEKNIKALRRAVPEDVLAAILDAPTSGLALVRDGADVNLDLGGGRRLYEHGAMCAARTQVEAYCRKPNRITLNPPDLESSWVKGGAGFYRALDESVGPLPAGDPAQPPGPHDPAVGALASFGCGLGLHLPLLRARLSVRSLIVAEAEPALIKMSFSLLDWAALIAAQEREGGRLVFAVSKDPVVLAAQVFEAIRDIGFERLDGSFGFRHYRSPALDEAHRLFVEQMPVLGSSHGFVEDEKLMIEQAAANLRRPAARIAAADLGAPIETPVLAIGNGPSLDGSIEQIKRLAPNAILISGGTALGALLEHGLTPDLHCEVENVGDVFDGLAMTAQRFDIRGIPMLCPPTVNPGMPDLVDGPAFYFQDTVGPTVLFGGGRAWRQAGPTVVNLAMRAALWLGATTIVLFGVDLGSVAPDRHHSGAGAYAWSDDPYWRDGAGIEGFDLTVPGNFRPSVLTNRAMMFNKAHFNVFATTNPGVTVLNCSDGARIEGAVPTDAASLDFPTPARPGGPVVRAAFDRCAPVSALSPPLDEALALYDAALADWEAAADAALAAADGFDGLLTGFAPMMHMAASDPTAVRAAKTAYRGSMLMVLQHAFAHYRRLDASNRPAFSTHVMPLLKKEWARQRSVMRAAIAAASRDP
ncbi:MAG: DUF115 domain-containing protein [Alphaproteobacteria bacterium]|nr:DUF115 domain-containing protein [Alphaproteobacteria bacterium]